MILNSILTEGRRYRCEQEILMKNNTYQPRDYVFFLWYYFIPEILSFTVSFS